MRSLEGRGLARARQVSIGASNTPQPLLDRCLTSSSRHKESARPNARPCGLFRKPTGGLEPPTPSLREPPAELSSPKTGLTADNYRNSRVRWFGRFKRDTAQIRPTTARPPQA